MYEYIMYDNKFWVIPEWQYEEFMSIERNSTNPTVNPYKFSVAMISMFRNKLYITMTQRHEGDFEVGFKRDWKALYEAINEGMRIYQEIMDSRKTTKKGKRSLMSLL